MTTLTQKEFWREMAKRTSEDAADFGFDGIAEEDLPGCQAVEMDECRHVQCKDLDAAAKVVADTWRAWQEEGR